MSSDKTEPVSDWLRVIQEALDHRQESHSLRHRRPVRVLSSTHVEIDGRRLVNFSSNNYLGLTHHPRVISAFEHAAGEFGVGSGAAPLVSGQSHLHGSAERALARWKNTESAVLLSSGYAANLAAVQTLASVPGKRAVRFLLDKLCHASLVDSVRAVSDERVTFRVFPHNHIGKLRRLLAEANPGELQVVVTESIFSMDGDAADLPAIAELKNEFPFLLLLDEAHGSGVYGLDGAGYAAELGLGGVIDIAIVTLSKALGCGGGAICASSALCEAVVNFGRSYVFSTSIPPAVAAAVETSIAVMQVEPHRQQRLRQLAARVRKAVLAGPGDSAVSDSPIIPIILGPESTALAAAEYLMQQGLLVVAVRPPTVPPGTSRLRIALSCDHTDEEVDDLVGALSAVNAEVRMQNAE